MPSRKRKAADATSTTSSTKRVTRSSANADEPKAQALTKSSKAKSKTPKATRKITQKHKIAKKALNPTALDIAERDDSKFEDHSTNANVMTIYIRSNLVKNPIQCQNYAAPSESNTSVSLIFTHGAGGTLSAPAVVNFCTGFSTALPVLAFQGSLNLKARAKGFRACIEEKREGESGERLVLGGRSMGARAAVMTASEDEDRTVTELVLVSYPLKGPKDDVRDQILLDLSARVRVLFIIGDRDAMCPLDMLEEVRSKMEARSQLVIVRGADHGMHTKPASSEKEHGEQTGRLAAQWLCGNMQEDITYTGAEISS